MADEKKTVVALGMFDGVHVGHKKLLDTAVLIAEARQMTPVVYTFNNHPQQSMGVKVARICSNEMREKYMVNLGIQHVNSVEFNDRIRLSSPQEFVDKLIETANPGVVVAGFNYTFGRKKAGNSELLQKLCAKQGVDTAIIPPVLIGKQPVSSTRIREMIQKGDVKNVQNLLGRVYSLTGIVCENRRIGRTIGFPTANIEADYSMVIPANGVYISLAGIGGTVYPAVTNVGSNPTVGGIKTTIETHILDFDEDVYGKTMTVHFIKRIRPDKKFSSIEELKVQIAQDVRTAGQYFGK